MILKYLCDRTCSSTTLMLKRWLLRWSAASEQHEIYRVTWNSSNFPPVYRWWNPLLGILGRSLDVTGYIYIHFVLKDMFICDYYVSVCRFDQFSLFLKQISAPLLLKEWFVYLTWAGALCACWGHGRDGFGQDISVCSRRTSSGKLGCFGDATSALEKLSTSKCNVITIHIYL